LYCDIYTNYPSAVVSVKTTTSIDDRVTEASNTDHIRRSNRLRGIDTEVPSTELLFKSNLDIVAFLYLSFTVFAFLLHYFDEN